MDKLMQMVMLLLIGLVFVRPAFVTFLFGYSPELPMPRKDGWLKGMTIWALCCALNMMALFVLHKLLFSRWNILQTIREIMDLRFTYQDILVFCQILASGTLVALALAAVLRMALHGGRLQGRRRMAAVVLLAGLCAADALLYQLAANGQGHIVINEIASNNNSYSFPHDTIYDYRVSDYIELYNEGSFACMTDGLYLSKDPDKLDQVALPSFRIPENGYMLIALDTPALSASKAGGETFFLSDSQGRIIDQATTQAVHLDHSWCRKEDGMDEWSLISSTPGTPNQMGRGRLETMPVFSHESGFYAEAFDLTLEAEEHLTIRYTVDGSVPTEDSAVYTGPIRVYDRSAEPNIYRNIKNVTQGWQDTNTNDVRPVEKAFVVRAIAMDAEGSISEVANATYFVNLEKYREQNVLSIIVDPEDLWGENGIYITGRKYDEWYMSDRTEPEPVPNFQRQGRDYEVEADVTCFSDTIGFSQKAGLRISGGSTRRNIVKRFNLYARDKYSGSSVFDTQIFEGIDTHKLSLRPGNANVMVQAMVSDRAVTTQKGKPAIIFLNGEIWYHAYLVEGYDQNYFAAHYRFNPYNLVSPRHINTLFNEGQDEMLKQDLYDFLNVSDMRRAEDYLALCERVDMRSYVDFLCIQLYCDNMDFDEVTNTVWWRAMRKGESQYEDGRWRFGLYDLDGVEWNDAAYWGLEKKAEKNPFTLSFRFANTLQTHPIYTAVKVNPDFQKQFTLTMMDLMNTNFRYENVEAFIDTFSQNNAMMTEKTQQFFKDFFRERPQYMQRYTAEEFGLSGEVETITLSVNNAQAGFIRLNTITPDLSQGEWTGEYFTDFPVEVTAVANEGYVFEKWEGDIESAEAQLSVSLKEGGTALRAVFRKAE